MSAWRDLQKLRDTRGRTPPPRSSEVQRYLEGGKAALRARDPEMAAKELRKVLGLGPKNTEANTDLGVITFFQGDFREAAGYQRKAVKSEPLNDDARYQLAMAHRDLNMPAESRHEPKLFKKIRAAKAQVRHLYRQKNKKTRTLDEKLSGKAH